MPYPRVLHCRGISVFVSQASVMNTWGRGRPSRWRTAWRRSAGPFWRSVVHGAAVVRGHLADGGGLGPPVRSCMPAGRQRVGDHPTARILGAEIGIAGRWARRLHVVIDWPAPDLPQGGDGKANAAMACPRPTLSDLCGRNIVTSGHGRDWCSPTGTSPRCRGTLARDLGAKC